MKKTIKYLTIHCTATPKGRPVSKGDILKWHTFSKSKGGRGWKKPGYSDMIHLNGDLENIMPFDQDGYVDSWEITNGVKGKNAESRHVVYVGGLDAEMKKAEDTRTDPQKKTLELYVKHTILRHPDIKVAGHNQFAAKACPSFDVPKWLKSIGIEDKNIYEQK